MSQSELARRAGTSRQWIINLEQGRGKKMRADRAARVLHELGKALVAEFDLPPLRLRQPRTAAERRIQQALAEAPPGQPRR